MARLIHPLLQRLEPSSVVLIGHSMGGATAQLAISEKPPGLIGFINVEGNLIGEDCTFSRQATRVDFSTFL